MMMTDSSGSVVWQAEFKPFGEPLSVTGSITNNLRFPGQYYDSETGLHYNYFRDYKPEVGRYVQADPIGIDGGINVYTYSESNPINLKDFIGLKACCNAQLPSSPIKEVALTCFAEASYKCSDGKYDEEKQAITDCIYNRVKENEKSWCTEKGVIGVLGCVYNGKKQFLGYGSPEYKKAENPKALNETECKKLNNCITAAQASSSGTQYSYTNFNQTKRSGRTLICNHYFW
jgi:RHS repeat-associated protein